MRATSHDQPSISLAGSKPGDVIDARYRVVDLLGPGWRWDVYYKARDVETDDEVVVKVASLPEAPSHAEALQKRAAWLSSIHHPNLAELRHFGQEGNDVYAVETWVTGPTFLQVKRRFPGIRLGHARPILAHLASGFDALIGRQWTHPFQLDLNEILIAYADPEQELAWRKSDSQGWGDMHVRFSPLGKPKEGDSANLVEIYATIVYELLGGDRDADTFEVLPNLSQEGNIALEGFVQAETLPGDCGSLLKNLCEIEELPDEDVLKISLLSDEHQALDRGLSHLADLGKKLEVAKREVAVAKNHLAKERAAFEAERDAFQRSHQAPRSEPADRSSWQNTEHDLIDREEKLRRQELEAKNQYQALKDEVAYLKKRPQEIRHSLANTVVGNTQVQCVIDNLKLQLETADTERQKLRRQVKKLESVFDPKAVFRRRVIAGSLTAAAVIVMGTLSYLWADDVFEGLFPCRAQWARFEAASSQHHSERNWLAVMADGDRFNEHFGREDRCRTYYDSYSPQLRNRVRRALIEFANPAEDPLGATNAAALDQGRPFDYLEHLETLEGAADAASYGEYLTHLTMLDSLLAESLSWEFLGDKEAARLAWARVGIPLLLHQGNARAALDRYVEVYAGPTFGSVTDAGRIHLPAEIIARLRPQDAQDAIASLESLESVYRQLDGADQSEQVRHDIRHLIVQAKILEALNKSPANHETLLKLILAEIKLALLRPTELKEVAGAVVASLRSQPEEAFTASLVEDLKSIGKQLEMPEFFVILASVFETRKEREVERAVEEERLADTTKYDQSLFDLYSLAANHGNPKSKARLAWSVWVKSRSVSDPLEREVLLKSALDIFEELVEIGEPDAIYLYAEKLLLQDDYVSTDSSMDPLQRTATREQLLTKAKELIGQLQNQGDLRARFLLGRWHYHRATLHKDQDETMTAELQLARETLESLCEEHPKAFPEAYHYLFRSKILSVGHQAALKDPYYIKYRDLGALYKDPTSLYFRGIDEGDWANLLESAIRENVIARMRLLRNLAEIDHNAPGARSPYLRPREVEIWYHERRELIEQFAKSLSE